MVEIQADNPYLAYKSALFYAFGCRNFGRPVFKERGINTLTVCDDEEDYRFVFGDLNYKYVSSLPNEDITTFNTDSYGKFFSEYGRVILANLCIVLCKADWYSVDTDTNGVAPYLANYYNCLLQLDYKLDDVIKEFKKEAVDEKEYSKYCMNYHLASDMIKKAKNEISASRDSKDIPNTEIFYCAYIGLAFALYGYYMILSQITTKFDIFSFFKNPKSNESIKVHEIMLREAQLGADEKKHLITLIFAFYRMSIFYNRTSGLDDMDPFIGTLYHMCEVFITKISKYSTEPRLADEAAAETAKTLLYLVDPDLTDENIGPGISLQSFTNNIDPINQIQYFRAASIIEYDTANIWEFGDVYLRSYKYKPEGDNETNISKEKVVLPPMKVYLEKNMKSSYSNEEVERAFGAVKNLLDGTEDKALFSNVDPGFILQLTIMAGAFRVLYSRETERSTKAKKEINAAIDIIDTLILRLYEIWFISNKYYIQPKRPNYYGRGIKSTLNELRCEVRGILYHYIEFVRYGIGNIPDTDKILYEDHVKQHFMHDKECNPEWINDQFTIASRDIFIRGCAKKQGHTIVQLALIEEDEGRKNEYAFKEIIKAYSREKFPKEAAEVFSKKPEEHVGMTHIDRIIDFANIVKDKVSENPELYAIAVYGMYYFAIDMILRTFNIGNYFDFGNAEMSLGLYNIESTVSKFIGVPLKKAMDSNL